MNWNYLLLIGPFITLLVGVVIRKEWWGLIDPISIALFMLVQWKEARNESR